jgi:hypothetical protein
VRTLPLILFNDVLWWTPFALFLAEGTRVRQLLTRWTPTLCAGLNGAAFLAMALVLRQGTEMQPDVAERVAYIAQHPLLWRGGWCLWIAAAISLAAFYAWWGGQLRHPQFGVWAVGIAAAGLMCDLAGESLLIGWLPRDYDRIAPAVMILTGGAANGLYTIGGVVLTVGTSALRGPVLALTWTMWLAGAAVTISTLAGTPLAIAISTTALFVMFCPWVLLTSRAVPSRPQPRDRSGSAGT